MSASRVCLVNTPDNFKGGKIYDSRLQWRKLSTDTWIHAVVHRFLLTFNQFPQQRTPPRPLSLSGAHTLALDSAVLGFVNRQIVERCALPADQGFFSNIFPVIKPDGTARVILNLKDFNDQIEHIHFKMETVMDVIHLVYLHCFFMTLDFKDAYFFCACET